MHHTPSTPSGILSTLSHSLTEISLQYVQHVHTVVGLLLLLTIVVILLLVLEILIE